MAASIVQSKSELLYKKIPFASKPQTAKILHDLENLYIEAVISGDRAGVRSSLKGMIRCKHLLGSDASTYEEEYRLYKESDKKMKKYEPKKSKKAEDILQLPTKRSSSPILQKITQNSDEIIFEFNKNIKYKDILFFELNSKSQHKDIYDIKAILAKGINKNLKISGLDRVALSQNNKEKIRVVFQDSSSIKSSAYIKDKKLIIHIAEVKKSRVVAKKQKKVIKKYKKSYKKIKRYSKSIVIDAGHGGKDSGAVGYNKYKEKDIILAISLKLRKILQARGFKVYMTRDRDIFIDLKDRTHFANLKKADLFISIHANATDKRNHKGLETYYLSPARSARAKRAAAKENKSSLINMSRVSKNTLLSFLNREKILQSNKLAIEIHSSVLKKLQKKYSGVKDDGVRPAPFWVLVGAQMPAILFEAGYLTNPTEAKRLKNPFYQKEIAIGIADGIEGYFFRN